MVLNPIPLSPMGVHIPLSPYLFTPLAKQIDKERKQSKNQKAEADPVHDKKRWFLAVDDGVGYGESATIISGIILNHTIPFAITFKILPSVIATIDSTINGSEIKSTTGRVLFHFHLWLNQLLLLLMVIS